MESTDPRKRQHPADDFIDHSVWHGETSFSNELLALHPEIRTRNIYTAAILGDVTTVNKYLLSDPSLAIKKGGPRNWDALTYLCFSKYLRTEKSRSEDFVAAAKALLAAGADIKSGFFDQAHLPTPEWESLLYGAAGVAFHPEMTALLLSHGADPNDNEVPYHSPETYDNAALEILLNSGKLTADSLAIMLVRKADFHDYDGMEILLKAAADPNRMTIFRITALHQAIRRDNQLNNILLLLNSGADPNIHTNVDGYSGIEIAARRGRSDLLNLFSSRGISLNLEGENLLLGACALNDQAAMQQIREREPELIRNLLKQDGSRLAEFAGNGNTEGIKCLIDLGVNVDSLYTTGDGYFGLAQNSSALMVAAWRIRTDTVRFLLERGADVNMQDSQGRTAIDLAVLACIDSYWMERRSPEIVNLLLNAGASSQHIKVPTGYDEIDVLLRK